MSKAKKYFIVGTDTGVGKSWITACMFAGFHHKGLRCLPVKPIQTGMQSGDDDTALYFHYTGLKPATRTPPIYQLPLPASPQLAARMVGVDIQIGMIASQINAISQDHDILLIEGAGGLLTPLTDSQSILDLVLATGASPVLVTRSKLGTLNHTALTLNELKRAGLSPAAVIVNDTEPLHTLSDKIIRDDNIVNITGWSQPAPVIHVEHTTEFTPELCIACGLSIVDRL